MFFIAYCNANIYQNMFLLKKKKKGEPFFFFLFFFTLKYSIFIS
jgi:hypothetical protein